MEFVLGEYNSDIFSDNLKKNGCPKQKIPRDLTLFQDCVYCAFPSFLSMPIPLFFPVIVEFCDKSGIECDDGKSRHFEKYFFKLSESCNGGVLMVEERSVVLIVDDYEEQANTLKILLEKEEYLSDATYRGKDALDLAERYPYDAIILDINMPDIEGTQLIERLRRINPEVVIIMLTGFPSQQNTMEYINYGANGYLVKPVSREKLFGLLEEKLVEQRQRRELT